MVMLILIQVNTGHGEMEYNPETQRWEGNEKDLAFFDPPQTSPKTPRLTTIAPVNDVIPKVYENMQYDSENLCWRPIGGVEDDIFAGLEDLADENQPQYDSDGLEIDDDWEIFDLGTEWERRALAEEQRYIRKTKAWIRSNKEVDPFEILDVLAEFESAGGGFN